MKTGTLLTCVLLIVSSVGLTANAQQARTTSGELTKEREQDGFNGAIRRVKVETAKITIKEGKFVEGPRVVRAITTYDIKGKRIDTVAHPVEVSTPSGREQYRYDDKGNIIEMVVRSEDGSILGREVYEYEFDDVGNWKKMTASIATYENGKLSFEPIEVTYRTLTYYYNQTIERIVQSSRVKNAVPANAAGPVALSNSVAAKSAPERKARSPVESPKKSPEKPVVEIKPINTNNQAETSSLTNASTKPEPTLPATPVTSSNSVATKPVPETEPRVESPKQNPEKPAAEIKPAETNNQTETSSATNNAVTDPAPTAAKRVSVKRVSEDVLRAAAVSLPPAEMPVVGQLRALFRRVEVQVVVDEKGDVTNARGTSPEPVFNEAAESAARKAKFSPSKLSDDPTQVFSIISYEFASGVSSPAAPTAEVKNETSTKKEPKEIATSDVRPIPSASPAGAAAENGSDPFSEGMLHLKKAEYAEAEDVLKRFVYRNPEDPIGYSQLGFAYFGQHKYVEAVAAFKMAIKIRPDLTDAQTYYLLGVSHNALKKYSDGAKALKQGIYVLRAAQVEAGSADVHGSPSFFLLHYNLGLSYQNMGNNRDAIKEFQQAANLDPKSGEPHYALAMVYLSMGDRKSIEKEQLILKDLNPDLAKRVADLLASRTLYIPPGCMALPCP